MREDPGGGDGRIRKRLTDGGEETRHPMSSDVSDVTVFSASPIAVAPSGPRRLSLACVQFLNEGCAV